MGRIAHEAALPLDVGVNLIKGAIERLDKRLQLGRDLIGKRGTP
jgi:hypothetical protein